MKIGFAARYDPRDKLTWSGTAYYTYLQLKKYGEVEIFQFPLPKLLQEWLTMQKSINRRWFGKQTSVEFLSSYARYFSRQLTAALKKNPVDILFVSASSQMIAAVKTDIPIVYMTDATFQQLQGYYKGFSNLPAYNIRQGIALDKKAFHQAAHCMLASDWCKQSAIADYGIESIKISVVPCGANLDEVPRAEMIASTQHENCRVVFLGVDWERKGGAIALEAFRQFRKEHSTATMRIIGCVPPVEIMPEEGIEVIPFLDKNKAAEMQRLHQILMETDLLLLPTRAECAGIVFCEAAAYGIPSISTNTGGVTTYVRDGINGYVLPVEAGGSEYASVMNSIWKDQQEYARLKKSSRLLYENELNWDAWGQAFWEIANRLTGS